MLWDEEMWAGLREGGDVLGNPAHAVASAGAHSAHGNGRHGRAPDGPAQHVQIAAQLLKLHAGPLHRIQ